jgi:hypothetical protein
MNAQCWGVGPNRDTCQGIGDGKFAKLRVFRISAALAMISHPGGNLQDALSQWQSTLEKVQSYWSEDFAIMICFYSISEITRRPGMLEESASLANDAHRLFEKKWPSVLFNRPRLFGSTLLGIPLTHLVAIAW